MGVVVDMGGEDTVFVVDEGGAVRNSKDRENRQRCKMHEWDTIYTERKLCVRQLPQIYSCQPTLITVKACITRRSFLATESRLVANQCTGRV